MYAKAPNGQLIIGTLEELPARADIQEGSFHRSAEGKIEFEYDGYTEVFWDGQTTVKDDKGAVLFLDREGNEWSAEQLTLCEEEAAKEDA